MKQGQTTEEEIFANGQEPGPFEEFLHVLGELTGRERDVVEEGGGKGKKLEEGGWKSLMWSVDVIYMYVLMCCLPASAVPSQFICGMYPILRYSPSTFPLTLEHHSPLFHTPCSLFMFPPFIGSGPLVFPSSHSLP